MRTLTIPLCLLVLVCVGSMGTLVLAQGGIQNPGFESGLTGWNVAAGNATVVSSPNNCFPTDGTSFLKLEATGTGNATPGWGPHTPGNPGVAQVYQDFLMPAGRRSISLAWEFIATEPFGTIMINDFVSIDLLDSGLSRVATIVFCDMGILGGTPGYANVPGAFDGDLAWVPCQAAGWPAAYVTAPAGPKNAFTDITSITTPGQVYRLAISLGNASGAYVDPVLFLDDVRLNVAQQNSYDVGLRVLGSSHVDGFGDPASGGGDVVPFAPFQFYANPGQRIAFRTLCSTTGTPWALVSGELAPVGANFPALGIINLDIYAPITFVLNGFAPRNPFEAMLGVISGQSSFLDGHISASAAIGQRRAYQAVIGDPGAATGISLTAATEIVTTGHRIPLATTLVPGGANDNSGFSAVNLTGIGSFNFYGVSHLQVFIGSNGSLTFGSGDSGGSENESDMITQQPRIAGIWDDLDPGVNGNGNVFDDQTWTTYTVSWVDVAEASNPSSRNTFTIQLYNNKAFTLYYGCTSMNDGLSGISPGGSIASGWDFNLSLWYGFNGYMSLGNTSSFFERFGRQTAPGTTGPEHLADKMDLMTLGNHGRPSMTFYPDSAGGYRVFTGRF